MQTTKVKIGIYKVVENGNSFQLSATSKADAESKYQAQILESAKRNKISEIKSKANKKIDSEYPAYKQRNFQLGLKVNGYDNATKKNEMVTFLEGVISKSEQLEGQVNAATTVEEVNNITIEY